MNLIAFESLPLLVGLIGLAFVGTRIFAEVDRLCRVVAGHRASRRPGGRRGCGHVDCGCVNPPAANYCRRCGRPLAVGARTIDARAA